MKKVGLYWIVIFSVIFTAVTLFSSTLMLILGETTDTHAHILMRAGFVAAAATTMTVFLNFKPKSKFLEYFIPYVIAQSMVFLMVFITSLITEIHPNAYRDAFFNFTGVSVIVIACLIGLDIYKIKKKKLA